MLISINSLAPGNLSSPLFLYKSLLPKLNVINDRIWLLVFEECIILLYLDGSTYLQKVFSQIADPLLSKLPTWLEQRRMCVFYVSEGRVSASRKADYALPLETQCRK